MKILFVSKIPTHPVDAGNRWATFSTCIMLKEMGCDVHFLYIHEKGLRKKNNRNKDEELLETKKYWNQHFHLYEINKFQKVYRNILQRFRKMFAQNHCGLNDEYPYRLHILVNNLNSKYKFDACIVNYVFYTKLFKFINIPRKVCYTHDTFAYRNLMVREKCIWISASQEAKALQLCTDIFALQEQEMNYFHVLSPNSKIYNIYCKYDFHPSSLQGNQNILFLSGSNIYNQNGFDWFISSVWPLIKVKFPQSHLLVAGSICKVIKNKYNDVKDMDLLGYVDNPADFYKLGDIAINPTYQGTGLKIKTFEAIAYDKITMVHPHSMQGVFRSASAPLFASEKPEEWVAFIEKVWKDKREIMRIKELNQMYIVKMNEYIKSEYNRFISN